MDKDEPQPAVKEESAALHDRVERRAVRMSETSSFKLQASTLNLTIAMMTSASVDFSNSHAI